MTTAATPVNTDTVTRYWKTGLLITTADITAISAAVPPPDPAGPQRMTVPPGSVTGIGALEEQFLASMNQLARAESADPVTAVTVRVETWRNRFDQPAFACEGRYAGWTFLSASEPEHSESGCLNLTDPRAGSALTAMPGLPWGRQFVIVPATGAHAVVPGWLTCSVVPLEAGQQITVAVAVSAS